MKNYIFLIVIFLSSCKVKPVENDFKFEGANNVREMIRIENNQIIELLPEESKDIRLHANDDFLNVKSRFVALDKKNGHISTIGQMLFHGNRIIISDREREVVFIYDTLGSSVNIINSRGKGPQEYYGLGQISIDNKNNELVLIDRLDGRIFYYDLDGKWLKTTKTKLNRNNIESFGKNTVSRSSYNMNWKIDNLRDYSLFSGVNDSVLYRGFKYMPFLKCNWDGAFFYKNYLNEVQYRPGFSDTIYTIMSDSSYYASYCLKFRKSLFEKLSHQDQGNNEIVDKFIDEGYQYAFGANFFELEDCILYSCVLGHGEPIKFFLYNKNNRDSYLLPQNMCLIKPDILVMPIGISNNSFVGYIEAYQLYDFKKKSKKDEQSSTNIQLEEIIKQIKENDNPVLVFYIPKFNDR